MLFSLLCCCWNKCWELVYCAGQDNIKLYATYEGQHRLACMSVDPVICQVNPVDIPSVLRNVVIIVTRRLPVHKKPPLPTPERDVSISHLLAILLNKDQFYFSGVNLFRRATIYTVIPLSAVRVADVSVLVVDVYNSYTFLTLDLCASRNPCTSAGQLAAQNEAHSASSHVMHVLCLKWQAVSFIRIM